MPLDIIQGSTPPSSPSAGDLWLNTVNGRYYTWTIGPSGGGAWVISSALGVAGRGPAVFAVPTPMSAPVTTNPTPRITSSDLPPTVPAVNDLWFDTGSGFLFIWYYDGNTYQWVVTNPGRGSDVPPPTSVIPILLTPNLGVTMIPNPITGVGRVGVDTIWLDARIASEIPTPPTTLPPSGAAGGDLSGSYPNPTIKPGLVPVSVLHFGAVGDGVTDDTAAIQAAINSVAAQGGGAIYFPAHTYAVSGTLNITTSGITLLGDNLNSSRILSTATTGNIIAVAGTAMASQVLGTTIRNLRIDAPATRTAGHGISLRFTSRTTVENVVLNTMWNGMEIYAANDTLVHRVNAPSLRGDYGYKYYAAGDGSNRSDVCSLVDSSVTVISPAGNGDGVIWDGGAFTFRMYRSELLTCRHGMRVQNTAASATWFPTFGVFSDLEIDQAATVALQLDSGQRLEFANCLMAGGASISGPIVLASPDAGRTGTLSFIGGNYQGANSNVFDIGSLTTRIIGVCIGDQRVAASAIVMRGTAADFTIADNTFTIVGGGHNGTYGVELQSGASKGVVGPNDYTSLTTGDVLNNSGNNSNAILGGVSRTGAIAASTWGPVTVGALTGTTATWSGGELVGYGTAVPFQAYAGSTQTPLAQIATAGQASLSIQRYVGGGVATGPLLNFSKSQGSTAGTQAIAINTDMMGTLSFNASDGVKFVEGAYIRAEVDGTPGLNDMPGRIIFATSPDGSAAPAEAMRISNTKAVTLAGPLTGTTAAFTGLVTALTPTPASDSSTKVATTAFVQGALPTTLPPTGTAGGGLSGTYPNPTIRPSTTNGDVLTTVAGVSAWAAPTGGGGGTATLATGAVGYGSGTNVLTGVLADFSWDTVNKRLGIGVAAPAYKVHVQQSGGDLFTVDTSGIVGTAGAVRALLPFNWPANGQYWASLTIGTTSGGYLGLFGGTGAPTCSTFGAYGSIYVNGASPGIPYYNNNGTTGWDQLVGANATQTLSNKTFGATTFTGAVTGTTATFTGGVQVGTLGASNVFDVKGTDNGNSLIVRATSGSKFLTIRPETAVDTTQIMYWNGSAAATINFPGATTMTGALTGTTATFSTNTLVGYGTAVPFSTYAGTANATPTAQVVGLALSLQRYTAGTNGPVLNLSKSASGAIGSQTVVGATDVLGQISFNGSDGTNFVEGAFIRAFVDGTPGLNDMPTRLVFATAPDGTATPQERMRIDNAGTTTIFGPLTTGAHTGTTATFSGAVGISGNTTLTGTSATGGHLLFNDTNTGGQVWQTGPGAGSGSPDEWVIYNQGTTVKAFSLAKTGSATFTGTVFAPGAQIQMVSVETGAVATGTTVIPFDDTVPQITEGDQYMTLAITPKSATSKLIIEVVWNGSHSVNTTTSVALFQDATANALAAVGQVPSAGGNLMCTSLRHIMTSGTTSATTFRVRAGGNSAGTVTFNGSSGARIYGGVMASSIVIREVAP